MRTRADHAAETAEDYVEAVGELAMADGGCRVVDLTRRFGVSHVTVIRILRRLANEGLVEPAPHRPILLTPAGRRLAARCAKRHALVVSFLQRLGVSDVTAARDAEGIEHHLSPETLRRIRHFVGGDG
jgi:DtxR family manganese transport transcriptional regulator